MEFIQTTTLSYDDICLVPRFSNLKSRSDADITIDNHKNPLINSPMIHTSSKRLIKYFVDNNMISTVHRYFKSPDDQLEYVRTSFHNGQDGIDNVYFAVGTKQSWIDTLIENGVKHFLIDMAHGHSQYCYDTLDYIRKKSPDVKIIAGNVATGQGYRMLIEHGADMVRVGIAGGSICSTAKATAFGVPMVTSILDCYDVQQEVGGQIIADGGIRSSADMLKAIACGADYVMCGKILASTSLAEGPFYDNEGNMVYDDPFLSLPDPVLCEYFGMASKEARDYNGTHTSSNVAIEGESGLIKYTGLTCNVINNIESNLRSGMSYNGSTTWGDFHDGVIIMQMSTAGQIEKLTHLY